MRNFLGGAQGFHRAVRDHGRNHLRAKVLEHVRIYWARGDTVDEYNTPDNFPAQGLREGNDASACG
jgi:hypothetical protein